MEDSMQMQFDKLLRKALADKYGLGPIVDDIEKMKPFMDKVNSMQDVIKGDEGKTPQRGTDYLTDEEMQQIRDELTPRKGEHYVDGERGSDGYTPVRGVDYMTDEDVAQMISLATPVRGKHYLTQAEMDALKEELRPKKGADYKDGENMSPQVFIDFLKTLKGKEAASFSKAIGGLIDISNVRNAESFIFNGTKYKTHELMHGGGSNTSSSSTIFVDDEIVVGAAHTFTLAGTPILGSQAIYGLGQRLTPGIGNDYTISGSVITTANSYSFGDILADYRSTGIAASVSFVDNEIVGGSGTSFTLATSPVLGTVQLYALGQRLTPGLGNDYTISGTVITTVNTYAAGDLLADYNY